MLNVEKMTFAFVLFYWKSLISIQPHLLNQRYYFESLKCTTKKEMDVIS